MQEYNSLNLYFLELSNIPQIEKGEYEKLLTDFKKGDYYEKEAAKKRMIEGHLLFAVKFAKHFEKLAELQDLIGVANLALVECIENYDWVHPFHTFAKEYLRREISRFLTQNSTVRISYGGDVLKRNIERITAQIEAEEGRDVTDAEIMHKLQISELQLKNARKRNHTIESLDNESNNDDGTSKIESIASDELNIVEILMMKDDMRQLAICLEGLTDKERYVICKHFGVFGNEYQTLETIGNDLKMTRQGVRRIEQYALQKMRSNYIANNSFK